MIGQHGWVELERSRFRQLWDELPPCTVLAALPGWGRTTWMRQCRAHRRGDVAHWMTDRQAVERFLAGPPERGTTTLYIDGVLESANDPLWPQLLNRLAATTDLRAVVTSIDGIASSLRDEARVLVIDERDLAFTAEETTALVAANAVEPPPDLLPPLTLVYRGCPLLVRRRLEHLRDHVSGRTWTSPAIPLDNSLVADLTVLAAHHRDSVVLRLFEGARDIRRFSAAMLAEAAGLDVVHAVEWLDRLRAAPFGSIDLDAESGHEVFEWSDSAWQEFGRALAPADREARLRRGLELTRRAGHRTTELFYLALLGEIAAAERLVCLDFRLFLLSTNRVTFQALRDVPLVDLEESPNLLLLLGEMVVRDTGDAGASAVFHQGALRALSERGSGDTSFDRLRRACRMLFGHVSVGDRERAREALDAVDLLLADNDLDEWHAVVAADAEVSRRFAAELFLPFWAATQLDLHDRALRYAALMRSYSSPLSPTHVAEELTALTEEIFAGLHLVAPGPVPPGGHTDCLVLIDSGRDAEALEFIRMLATRVNTAAARSASEALILLVRALLAPSQVTRDEIALTLSRSRRFWNDGRPSTFVALAATFACLVIDEPAAAARCAAEVGGEDWFGAVAGSLVALAGSDGAAALRRLDRADATWRCPRARAVTGVLAAVTHLRLGSPDAAAVRLRAAGSECPLPLLRFAFRLVTAEDCAALAAQVGEPADELAEMLAVAASDPRPLRRGPRPRLTAIEREMLLLLREGLSNSEIAAARYVSINTVRTQLITLWRKLGVHSRAEAVARAEQLGLFAR